VDSITHSCGDPICTFCKDQLRSHEAQNKGTNESSEDETPQASVNKSSHENTRGSEDDDEDDDDEHSHKAQVGYSDSLEAQEKGAGESSKDGPPEGADESSQENADRSSHITKVLDNMRIRVE
jgi:hypothetical protein